jgi:acyl carrier protein
MDTSVIIQEIQPIFADVLDSPDLQLTRESNGHNVDGWDSLAHINLVLAIEKHYKIKFALGELQDLKNVGEMAALIQRKLQC